jgi:hypothetical protein
MLFHTMARALTPAIHHDAFTKTILSSRPQTFNTSLCTTQRILYWHFDQCVCLLLIPQRLNIFGLPISLHLLYYKKKSKHHRTIKAHLNTYFALAGTGMGCRNKDHRMHSLVIITFFHHTSVALFHLKRIPIAFIIFFSRQTFIKDGGYSSISLRSSDTIHHHL